jgi:hypothetical protein
MKILKKIGTIILISWLMWQLYAMSNHTPLVLHEMYYSGELDTRIETIRKEGKRWKKKKRN